jgi:hypothetical protein
MTGVRRIDAQFFARYPDRDYRGRPAFSAEVEWGMRLESLPPIPPPGIRFFMVVRRVAPGVFSHVVVAVSNADDEGWIEISEDISREWYDHAVTCLAGMPEVLH